jgi:hypothetical protein
LKQRLLELFPGFMKYDCPVHLAETSNLGFCPYINKALKINDLLRTGRAHLAELLLTLDRIKPLDLMVTNGLVLSAQRGGFTFQLAR